MYEAISAKVRLRVETGRRHCIHTYVVILLSFVLFPSHRCLFCPICALFYTLSLLLSSSLVPFTRRVRYKSEFLSEAAFALHFTLYTSLTGRTLYQAICSKERIRREKRQQTNKKKNDEKKIVFVLWRVHVVLLFDSNHSISNKRP